MENPKRAFRRFFASAQALFFIALLHPLQAFACEAYSEDANNTQSLLFGAIAINVEDVFNHALASENLAIHRAANRFHIKSKRELIESQLLFKTGDVFDADTLAETARNLRANRYLRSATVTPIQICDGNVDIKVVTGDNWSLIPGFSFARAGGENEYAFQLSELNLLGLGKSLEIELIRTPERDQRVLLYNDPLLLGTKTQLTTQLQDNSDGEVQIIELEQPFFSLDTRNAWRVSAGNTQFLQALYDDGRVSNQLAVDRQFASVEYGFSKGKQRLTTRVNQKTGQHVFRWRLGWSYERLGLGASLRFPDSTPVNERIYSYPFIQLRYLRPEFITQTNLQLMESIEDIAIGHALRARVGLASESFGSHTDAIVLETAYSKGWQPNARLLGRLNSSASGYLQEDRIEDGLASVNLQGFYFASQKLRSFVAANFVSSARLFEHRQVVLGGDTGLRGYPLRFQTGSRRARFTAEQRYFFDWYPLRLVRIGAAAFADIGSAWDKGEDPTWLRDVGVGLRLVNTRQAGAKVMHIDFAFPLDETDRVDSFQLVVSAKAQF